MACCRKMLEYRPEDRITPTDALRDPFILAQAAESSEQTASVVSTATDDAKTSSKLPGTAVDMTTGAAPVDGDSGKEKARDLNIKTDNKGQKYFLKNKTTRYTGMHSFHRVFMS